MKKKPLANWPRVRGWFNIKTHLDGLFALLECNWVGLRQLLGRGARLPRLAVPKRRQSYLLQLEGLEERVVPTTVQFASYDQAPLNMYGTGQVTSINIDVTLDGASTSDVSIDYQTCDDSARAGVDYGSTAGTLVIPAGSTVGSFQVPILGATGNGDAAFGVMLSNPVNADMGDLASTTVVIDEPAALPGVNFNASATQRVPHNGVVTLEVDLKVPAPQTLSVDFATADDTGAKQRGL